MTHSANKSVPMQALSLRDRLLGLSARSYFFLLLGLLILVRLPTFLYPILDEDEAIHATLGTLIASGFKPYLHGVDGKFPLLWDQYSLVFKIFGLNNMFAMHAYTLLIVLATAWLLFRAGELLKSRSAGLLTGLFYALFTTASYYKILASNFELHLLVFEALAIFLVLRGRAGRPHGHWFLAGICAVLSILTKQQGGMILFSLPIAYAVSFRPRVKTLAGFLVALGAGVLVAAGIFLWHADRQGFLHDMVYWTIIFPKTYIAEGTSHIAHWSRGVGRIAGWVVGTYPLWIAALFALWRHFRTPPVRFALILLLGSFVPVSLGGRFFAHYFLLTLPGLSLLAAIGFDEILARPLSRRFRVSLVALTLLPVLTLLAINLNMPQMKARLGIANPNFKRLGEAVRRITKPDDRIFVWGWAPEFHVFSNRLPASRFLLCDYLAGRVAGSADEAELAQGYKQRIIEPTWQMLKEDFAKHPPKLIIDSSAAGIHYYKNYPMQQYEFLREYVRDFEKVDLGGVPGYLRRDKKP